MFKVGQDVESICGKCGDVWHVVVAMNGTAVAKVQCKQCGAYHRHRPPGGASASTTGKAKGKAKATSRGTGGRAKKKKEPEGPLVEANGNPARRYRIGESFELGDTVEHPTFGTGLVELVLEDKKVQVYFSDGRRILAHQR